MAKLLLGSSVDCPSPPDRLRSRLPAIASSGRTMDVVTAYHDEATFALMRHLLAEALDKRAELRLLLGMNGSIRRKNATAALGLLGAYPSQTKMRLLRLSDGLVHPKMYLVNGGSETRARHLVIGSSNCTDGGMTRNIEINVHIEDSPPGEIEPAITDAHALFEHLWGKGTDADAQLWERAIREAPAEEEVDERPRKPAKPQLIPAADLRPAAEARRISAPTQGDRREDDAGTSSRLLALQLADTEVRRKPWYPAVGTASINLSKEEVDLVRLFGASLLGVPAADFEGTGLSDSAFRSLKVLCVAHGLHNERGSTRQEEINLHSRQRERDGSLELSELRFSWTTRIRSFLGSDLGRAPVEGDCVLIRWIIEGSELVGPIDIYLVPASHKVVSRLADGTPRSSPSLRYKFLDPSVTTQLPY